MNVRDSSCGHEPGTPNASRHFSNGGYGQLRRQLQLIADGQDGAVDAFLEMIQSYMLTVRSRLEKKFIGKQAIDEDEIHDAMTDSLMLAFAHIRRKGAMKNWNSFTTFFSIRINTRIARVCRKNARQASVSLDEITRAEIDEACDEKTEEFLPLHETIPSRTFASDAEEEGITAQFQALVSEVEKLEKNTSAVIKMKFGIGYEKEMRKSEIARVLNIAPVDVGIKENRALNRLRQTPAAHQCFKTLEEKSQH